MLLVFCAIYFQFLNGYSINSFFPDSLFMLYNLFFTTLPAILIVLT